MGYGGKRGNPPIRIDNKEVRDQLDTIAESKTDWVNVMEAPYASLQAAVDFTSENRLKAYLPKRDYILNEPLLLGDNTTLLLHEHANIIRNFAGEGTGNSTIRNKDQVNGNRNIKIVGGNLTVTDSTMIGKHLGFWKVDVFQMYETRIDGAYADWMLIMRDVTNFILSDLDLRAGASEALYTDGIHISGGCKRGIIHDCQVEAVDDALAFTIENQYDTTIDSIVVNGGNLTTKKASVIKIMLSHAQWEANRSYTLYNQVIANGHVYKCMIAGTTGSTAPSHTTGTATDGTVTWQYVKDSSRTDFPPYGQVIKNIQIANITSKGGTLNEGQAIWLDDRTGMKRITDITLDVIFSDCRTGAGYGLQATHVGKLKLIDITLQETQGTSMLLEHISDLQLIRPIIDNPRGLAANGISLNFIDYYKIDNPTIDLRDGNTGNGILVGNDGKPVKYGSITHPIIRGVGNNAISLIYSDSCHINGGHLRDCGKGIIESGNNDYNTVENVDVRGVSGTKISLTASTSRMRQNPGFKSENTGVAGVPIGSTSRTVYHGMVGGADINSIRLTPQNSLGNVTKYRVTNITTNSFDIVVDQDPVVGEARFGWYAAMSNVI